MKRFDNFFLDMPSVAFKALYKRLDADSKRDLSNMILEDGGAKLIQDSGVHVFKERHHCPVCPFLLVWNEFHRRFNKDDLGFHLLYQQVVFQALPQLLLEMLCLLI